MYAELDLKFKKPIVSDRARATINDIIGMNKVDVAVALAESSLASVPGIVQSALASEQVMNIATVIYFMEGNDTIKAHIIVRSLAEVKKQCSRITRQLSGKVGALSTANATVLVQVRGNDEAVLFGEKCTFLRHMWNTTADKSVAKILPAVVTFALATLVLPGSTVVVSAAIGAAAAAVVALFEAGLAAYNSEEWKWKEGS